MPELTDRDIPDIPQPESKIQPVRVIPQREEHRETARAGGVDDLVEFRAFYTREVLLFGAVAGPEDGWPVVLLHGFPDFWLGWARQIRPLVEAGARVLIPDQRGYNRSEKPADVDAYRTPVVGRDVLDLIDAAGWDDAHVVGHDWGGGVTWWLADHHPDRLKTATILNCPHPVVLGRALQGGSIRQMLKSWYIALFQIPKLPELLAQTGDYGLLAGALETASEGAFTDEELQMYRRAWGRERALEAMINWYRAAGRQMLDSGGPSATSVQSIRVPTRIIWGANDKALGRSLIEPSARRVEDVEVDLVEGASHWVQRDAPGRVNDWLAGLVER